MRMENKWVIFDIITGDQVAVFDTAREAYGFVWLNIAEYWNSVRGSVKSAMTLKEIALDELRQSYHKNNLMFSGGHYRVENRLSY